MKRRKFLEITSLGSAALASSMYIPFGEVRSVSTGGKTIQKLTGMKCTKAKRLEYTKRAEELVKSLTLEEKVSLMGGNITLEELMTSLTPGSGNHYNSVPYVAGGIESKGVPAMKFCDGPRGVVCGTGKSTCYPVSMLRGATFNTELEEKIGHAIGKEVRAFGGNLFAGVCINLPYNPGWGRSQETYGEDSFHIGQMGAALVRGVQNENVVACIKHYAFNQMEISRFKVSVSCDKRTEREVFLPHFKDCLDAGAASFTSSYNLFQGTKCGHHKYLLNTVLKKEWDFDGFVMSDFVWGVTDTVEAANGGQDMEMCNTMFFGERLVRAVREGFVPEEKIDQSATRIIRTLLAFEDAYDQNYDESVIGSPEHIQLALQSAREGITLLQNKNSSLPFSKKTVKKILVLGRLANTENTGDNGSSKVFPAYVVTPLEGLKKLMPKAKITYYEGSDMEQAKTLAAASDAVVVVAGYDFSDEGEYVSETSGDAGIAMGGDRLETLGLHKEDIDIIKAVGPVNKNTAVVLFGGNMIMIDDWKDYVNSILMAYYPGMEGGTAIAEILFGDVNPSGKLPYVTPEKESDLPQVNWDTESQFYDYYHGYRKLDKENVSPDLPYGFGLSYTTFQLYSPEFSTDGKIITGSCTVRNTGDVEGTEVVQLYAGFRKSAIDRPVKTLTGFSRVSLKPGEVKKVAISCPVEKLYWYNPLKEQMELEHMDYEVYIGTSSDPADLMNGTIRL